MIRREDGESWLLVSQVDHAHLAGEVAAVWGNERVPALPVADLLVPAIRDHDEGWRTWEDAPQVDPASDLPRNFTEMPMPIATRLWSESIEAAARGNVSHAEAMQRYDGWLRSEGQPLTPERATVLDVALGFRGLFGIGELQRAVGRAGLPALGRVELRLILSELASAGIVRCARNRLREPAMCEMAVGRIGAAPLGGIWVSRHFCWLAEQALPSRGDQPDERDALERFLQEQAERQARWTDDAVRDFAGEHLDRLLNAGFRYVQFFDRLSLWLCMAERTEPQEIELPSGQPLRFTPQSPTEIAVDPYPLAVSRLELIVPARRIPRRPYADDTDLHAALSTAPVVELHWSLVRGS